jgi:hypothetical protein
MFSAIIQLRNALVGEYGTTILRTRGYYPRLINTKNRGATAFNEMVNMVFDKYGADLVPLNKKHITLVCEYFHKHCKNLTETNLNEYSDTLTFLNSHDSHKFMEQINGASDEADPVMFASVPLNTVEEVFEEPPIPVEVPVENKIHSIVECCRAMNYKKEDYAELIKSLVSLM